MDRTTIIVIILCVIAIVLVQTLPNMIFPTKPLPPGATNVATAPMAATNAPAGTSTTSTATAPGGSVPLPVANTNIPEQVLVLTNEDGRYTFSSYGGGLKTIEVEPKKNPKRATNEVVTLNKNAPAPTLAILGGEAVQGDGIFTLTNTAHGIRAEKALSSGLVLVKEFELTNNYLVNARVRMENRNS